MKKDNQTKIAHRWLREHKASENLNYKEISYIIGYTDVGTSKAMRNETLSFEQVKMIAIEFNKLDEFNQYLTNESSLVNEEEGVYEINSNRLGEYLFKNHDKLMATDTSYEMFIRKIAAEEGLKMVKDLLPKNK